MPEKTANIPFPGYIPDDTFTSLQHEQALRPEESKLPFLTLPRVEMELFDPEKHLANVHYRTSDGHSGPSGATPPQPLYIAARANPNIALIPRPEDCYALWDKYEMLDNIRAHSSLVASLSLALARLGAEKGIHNSPDAVYAAALLHDLSKTYTIAYGGNHAQLGAAWVMHETRNTEIASCVLYHVHWPWEEHFYTKEFFSVMAIEYADKRVRHDSFVSLADRFEDLLVRYGKNDYAKQRIRTSYEQGKRIEAALSGLLGVNLHEYTADSGWLVK